MATFTTTINSQISTPNLVFSTKFQTRTSKTLSTQLPISFSSSSSFPSSTAIGYPWNVTRKENRGLGIITRAAPTTTNLIFAFVMPLTLILATVFTSIRIADKLDEDFLEEIAMNKAIMEEEEDQAEDSSATVTDGKPVVPAWAQEKPAAPRVRNRRKREAEV